MTWTFHFIILYVNVHMLCYFLCYSYHSIIAFIYRLGLLFHHKHTGMYIVQKHMLQQTIIHSVSHSFNQSVKLSQKSVSTASAHPCVSMRVRAIEFASMRVHALQCAPMRLLVQPIQQTASWLLNSEGWYWSQRGDGIWWWIPISNSSCSKGLLKLSWGTDWNSSSIHSFPHISTYINCNIPRGFEAETFTGQMPIMSHNPLHTVNSLCHFVCMYVCVC